MSTPRKPSFETRRTRQLREELLARARVWLPDWRPQPGEFGAALLSIAGRLESEATARLDRIPEKTLRGFFAWLGVRGMAARAARLPVVFSMNAKAEAIDAAPPVQLQAVTPEAPLIVETEQAVRIVPGKLADLIAVKPADDALYLSPVALGNIEAPTPLPEAWRVKVEPLLGATQLQLEPALGLTVGLTLEDVHSRLQYRVNKVDGNIVTLEPPLGSVAGTRMTAGEETAVDVFRRVSVFDPFAEPSRNRQEHALYLGAADALNVESAALIEIRSERAMATDADWFLWAKASSNQQPGWLQLKPVLRELNRTLLLKPKAAVEPRELNGASSRWLKATRQAGASVQSGGLRLFINCDLAGVQVDDPELQNELAALIDATGATLPVLEGVANTVPLVLNAPFYPFGREPRQFDSFYVASKEAFSKALARVSLGFTFGDAFATPLAVTSLDTRHLIVSVLEDGRLQRMWLYGASELAGATVLFEEPPAMPASPQGPLALNRRSRPGASALAGYAHFSVAAGFKVYVYKQLLQGLTPDWVDLDAPVLGGLVPGSEVPMPVEDTALVRVGVNLRIYAVHGGNLYQRWLSGPGWSRVASDPDLGSVTSVARIAPFLVLTEATPTAEASVDDLLYVTTRGELFRLRDGLQQRIQLPEGAVIDSAVYPLGLYTADDRTLCFVQARFESAPLVRLVAFELSDDVDGGMTADVVEIAEQELEGATMSFVHRGGTQIELVAVVRDDATARGRPFLWDPWSGDSSLGDAPAQAPLLDSPVVAGPYHAFPNPKGALSVTVAANTLHRAVRTTLTDAILYRDFGELITKQPVVAVLSKGASVRLELETQVYKLTDQTTAIELRDPLPVDERPGEVQLYSSREDLARSATLSDDGQALQLADGDLLTALGSVLLLEQTEPGGDHARALVKVRSFKSTAEPGDGDEPVPAREAILEAVHGSTLMGSGPVTYWIQNDAIRLRDWRILPVLDLDGIDAAVRDDMAVSVLRFLATPNDQTIIYENDRDDLPRAVLNAAWTQLPGTPVAFDVISLPVLGPYAFFEPARDRNPELFWEYWNGTSWWRIPGLVDNTANLLTTGDVSFCVPADLQPTDVLGRSNHWIRARLVGGDYGQESVSVLVEPQADGKTKQTVQRNKDSIRAPYVLGLLNRYEVCCPVTPDFVLSADGNSLRNQTDANRAPGAVVDYFVPLSEMLTPLSAETAEDVGGPALYLGFDVALQGGPLNVLFVLDEGLHEAAYPIRLEVLLDGKFQAVVVEDGTRGLNETGIVSFVLARAPQLSELFGQARYWMRIKPGKLLVDVEQWRPRIRAAYLNAAWASAAETQTLELLGSSDGSPHQRVRLARPPVLEGSLELRVREPLGDEEIEQLRGLEAALVLDALGPREGPWVRWREVSDPLDYGPGERVYALDASTGELRFGDGAHGMIPPIGRDVFLARQYKRGGGNAGNQVRAWSPVSLLTPLSGVEAAVAPLDGAGGADPQDRATTLRFAPANVRMRGRAQTLRDLEQLALQFSPDVAQVRARAGSQSLRLIVVMRGREPRPSMAVLRELRRYLLDRAAPQFAVTGVLRLLGPDPVPLRVQVAVTIESVGQSGAVARALNERIAALFDPSSGGEARQGWPLGQLPEVADIAAALLDVPGLEALDDVAFMTLDAEGRAQPLASLRPTQLVQLASEGVRIDSSVAQEESVA